MYASTPRRFANPVTRLAAQQWVLCLCLVLVMTGCEQPVAQFRLNQVYLAKQQRGSGTFTGPQLRDLADVLTAMFGTPDEPFIPAGGDSGIDQLFDGQVQLKLAMAAGPVSSDQQGNPRGLYRKHCAHCHGITGDGAGPTAAFLNPYPRDYRKGVFKFKSTPIGRQTTHEDLTRILVNGIPGTAMPSFRLLDDDELDALVHYVKYLSIRGEVERRLIMATRELDKEKHERLDTSPEFLLDDVLAQVVRAWLEAPSQITNPAPPPWDDWDNWDPQEKLASRERGRHLYYGGIANCMTCHGDTQLGDAQTSEYDDWSKDFFDGWATATDAKKKEMMSELVALGGLPPRNSIPRNLRQGVYRGGRRLIDIYRRIFDGIAGTPMPKASMKPEGALADAPGLTPADIWDLVNYVQSLPYEPLSQPLRDRAEYSRERM